ncbi:soluble NSF attachment protein [Trichoderma velutinum]
MYEPHDIFQRADNLVSKGSNWSFFGRSDERFWTAARLFREAAQAYQLDRESGEAHKRAAKVRQENLKDLSDAADSYENASDAYCKCKEGEGESEAVKCLDTAFKLIQESTSENKSYRQSRILKKLGGIYENGLKERDLDKARGVYEEAGELIHVERELSANELFAKYADLSAESGHYDDAIEYYQRIIKSLLSKDEKNWKWSLSAYYFKVCICRLAVGDAVDTGFDVEEYQAKDDKCNRYKYELIFNLRDAMKEYNREKFGKLVSESNQDNWTTKILRDVEKRIEPPDDEFA